jgi:hypothetical protein
LSNQPIANAQNSRTAEPLIGPPIGATAAWSGTVNGHAQAVVIIATVGYGKPNQS